MTAQDGGARAPAQILEAAGWAALALLGLATLGPAALAPALASLAVARALGRLSAAATQTGPLAALFLASAPTLAALTTLFTWHPPPLFQSLSAALPVTLALTLTAALSQRIARPAKAALGPLLGALTLAVLARVTPLTAEAALLALLFAELLLLALLLAAGPRPRAPRPAQPPLETLTRSADLLLLPLLFAPLPALAYLLARGLAAPVTLILDRLEALALPALTSETPARRAAVAARVNLGALLLSGAVALSVLAFLGLAPPALLPPLPELRACLPWLLLAALARGLWGLAPLLARLTGLGAAVTPLRLGGLGAFLLLGSLAEGPVELARALALTELMVHGALATLLALRRGIWPGATALLFRQIRLFQR